MLSELINKANFLHLNKIKRHIFLCCDQGKANCCSQAQGLASWEYLKNRLDELGLTKQGGIHRTKANCLRVCIHGPIAVVHPDNIWYHSCSPETIEKIIQEHLIKGNPVKEFIIPFNNLPPSEAIQK